MHDLTFGHIRQLALALIVVEALLGDVLERGEEAGEHDDGARCAELGVLAVGRGSADLDGGGRDLCVDHLRGDSALPDQLVKRELVSVKFLRHLAGRAEHIAGRTNGLMRLLRILDLAVVAARNFGDVLGAVKLTRLIAGSVQRLIRQRGGVGTHVRDVAVLVQRLSNAHRALRTPAKALRGLLLQGRGHERC